MATRRPPSSGPYHHGNLRNALLAAARDLLEERGPSSLGLREIARRVGVSAPSAYHHFPSLDAIAVGLAEQGAAEMAQCLKVPASGDKSRLLRIGEAYVGFARANPALYRLMFGEGFPAASRRASGRRFFACGSVPAQAGADRSAHFPVFRRGRPIRRVGSGCWRSR